MPAFCRDLCNRKHLRLLCNLNVCFESHCLASPFIPPVFYRNLVSVFYVVRPFFVDFHKNLSASAAFFAIKKLRKKDIPKIHLNAVAEAIP